MKKSEALNILGLSEGATDDAVKKAHRSKVIANHPDNFQEPAKKSAAEEQTKLINEARDVLLSRKWDPEFGGAGTVYGNPYRSPYQGAPPGAGSDPYGWPFNVNPDQVWTEWQKAQQRGAGGQHTSQPFDPFDPFSAQQATANDTHRAARMTTQNLEMTLGMLLIKLVIVVTMAFMMHNPLGGLVIWVILTMLTTIAGRLGGCIWLVIFPLLIYFPSIINSVGYYQASPLVFVPVLALFALALVLDAREVMRVFRSWRVAKKAEEEKNGN